jgi:hypothetical protein
LFTAGPKNFNERTAYIGALPLLLAFAALGRRRPREQWFFVGLAVVSLATVFNTPVWANAVRDLPGGRVAALGRLLILVSLAGAVLAAYGLQRWQEGSTQERRRMLWIMCGVAAVAALAWLPRHTDLLSGAWKAIGQLPAVHHGETSWAVVGTASLWRWILICGLGLIGLALASRRRSPMLALVLVLVLTGADLVALDRGYHGSIPLSEADPPVPASIRYLQDHQGSSRVTGSDFELLANLGERYGLRDPRIAIDIPYPTRYDRLWTALGGIGGDHALFFANHPLLANHPQSHLLADIFATRYVLLPPDAPAPSWLHPVLRTAGGTVAMNPTSLPRAWIAYSWRQAKTSGGALALTVHSTSGQLRDEPVIEGSPPPPASAGGGATVAKITSDGPEEVVVDATARRGGYLILDDSAYPGWTAAVDGRRADWRPANENFRAVSIAAGRHIVRFSYGPASVLSGAIVTVISLLALLALALSGYLRARRQA